MRTTAALVLVLALANAAWAANGAPSREVLADMGLGGMQIMSDDEAAGIRGSGFSFDGFDLYKQGLHDYKHQVKKFHKQVKKFQHKIEKVVSHWPTGVKPHHGGGMGY